MVNQPSRDTAPEMAIRRRLHARGYRYRVDYPVLPRRRADIVFPRQRVTVFVDGCFWHQCPEHATKPTANGEWWERKLAANVQRDRDTDRRLRELDWQVVRVWEHEAPEESIERIEFVLREASR